MTENEKQLLLKDLCGRLPYGVMVHATIDGDNTLLGIYGDRVFTTCEEPDKHNDYPIECIKPYLRPMSSMTEEEKKELKSVTCPKGTGYFDEQYLICPMSHFGEHISYDFMSDILDWLNAHHFDYRGLIEKGLAIEVPKNIYK